MGKVTWRNANGEEVLISANVGLLNRRNVLQRDYVVFERQPSKVQQAQSSEGDLSRKCRVAQTVDNQGPMLLKLFSPVIYGFS
jgi:hypothetical protein